MLTDLAASCVLFRRSVDLWCLCARAQVPKTFLNQDTCNISRGCAPLQFSDQPFVLNGTILPLFYTAGGKYVYVIDGLRLQERYERSPCQDLTSRWRALDGPCTSDAAAALDAYSRSLLLDNIRNSNDQGNPFVRDIRIPDSNQRYTCWSASGKAAIGIQLEVDGTCWQHVHPDTLNVYDFTRWTVEHPGNTVGFNPIKAVALAHEYTINFPASHPMSRWPSIKGSALRNGLLGRLGDVRQPAGDRTRTLCDTCLSVATDVRVLSFVGQIVSFDNLPSVVQTTGFAKAMGELTDDMTVHELVEVCDAQTCPLPSN